MGKVGKSGNSKWTVSSILLLERLSVDVVKYKHRAKYICILWKAMSAEFSLTNGLPCFFIEILIFLSLVRVGRNF